MALHLTPPPALAPTLFDRYDDFVADIVRPAVELAAAGATASASLVGIPFDTTTLGRRGSRYGPAAVREALAGSLCYNAGFGVDLAGRVVVADHGNVDVLQTDVEETWRRVSEAVSALDHPSRKLIVLGGDHGLTFPVLRGLARKRRGKIGVISVDAHFDVRVSQHDEVSAGVPFRRVLEDLPEAVSGKNLVLFGIGGWRNTWRYAEYLDAHRSHVITAREIHAGDVHVLAHEALARAGDGTTGIWLSIDVDGVDNSQAAGTGTPAIAGITAFQLLELVWAFGRDPKAVGIDVMEVAPAWDHENATANLAAACILTFLAGFVSGAAADQSAAGDD